MPKNTPTQCFTYKVTMFVQVLANDEISAKKQLEDQGGYLSKREVYLLDSVTLLSTDKE